MGARSQWRATASSVLKSIKHGDEPPSGGAERGPLWSPLTFSRARLACLISAGTSLDDKRVYLLTANTRQSDNMRCCFPNEDTGAFTKASRVPQPQTNPQHPAKKDIIHGKSIMQHILFNSFLLKKRSLLIKELRRRDGSASPLWRNSISPIKREQKRGCIQLDYVFPGMLLSQAWPFPFLVHR